MEDNRLVFDIITELFDKWRPRYSQELYDYIVKTCGLDKDKRCLEIGPGTGQATDFALKSGCDYSAIELGVHLADFMKKKYSGYENFKLINADFETYSFENNHYDLVYSAAAIQWIKEEVAYSKCVEMLKDGGYLAIFYVRGDYKASNPELYSDIQKVYDEYFKPETPYTCKFNYKNGTNYGLKYLGTKEFYGQRVFNADEYIEYIHTHSDHTSISEGCKEPFFNGIHKAIVEHGNQIVFNDTYVLYLYQKEMN
jgi:SAM-dependent methyltransferase